MSRNVLNVYTLCSCKIEQCIVPKNLTLNTFKQPMGYGRLTEKKVHRATQEKRKEQQGDSV